MAVLTSLSSTNPPTSGDVVITSTGGALYGIYATGSTEYLVASGGQQPGINLYASQLGTTVVHALPPNPDGTYQTVNAAIDSQDHSAISGPLIIGAIGANEQLARANVNVAVQEPSAKIQGANLALLSNVYVAPQSTLSTKGGIVSAGGTLSFNGGSADFASAVTGNASFDLEAYLSDPTQACSAVVTFQGSASVQGVHVGYGSQLNLGAPLAFHGAISEDPVSQVVLRGTTADDYSYQNGLLSVIHSGMQVADLTITPTGGANGFSMTQIGPDAVISAVTLSPQELANASMPTTVLQHG